MSQLYEAIKKLEPDLVEKVKLSLDVEVAVELKL
jgi:hypothetical protein